MTDQYKRKPKRISRSVRLKKYEVAYEACLKKSLSINKKSKSVKDKRKHRKSSKAISTEKPSKLNPSKKNKDIKRPLNTYQKFVRKESKKSKYKGMIPSERMRAIGKIWKSLK